RAPPRRRRAPPRHVLPDGRLLPGVGGAAVGGRGRDLGALRRPSRRPRPRPRSPRPDRDPRRGHHAGRAAAAAGPDRPARLARRSGYGAGVTSPGWYAHLFTCEGEPVAPWLARTARLLRAEGMEASSASVIEATRLAGALAAVRGRPVAGLAEVLDATQAV